MGLRESCLRELWGFVLFPWFVIILTANAVRLVCLYFGQTEALIGWLSFFATLYAYLVYLWPRMGRGFGQVVAITVTNALTLCLISATLRWLPGLTLAPILLGAATLGVFTGELVRDRRQAFFGVIFAHAA